MNEYRPYNRNNRPYWQSNENNYVSSMPVNRPVQPIPLPADCPCSDKKKKPMPEQFVVGIAYVPWQQWEKVYNLDEAFKNGTLFPELDKKFHCAGGVCR